jgi:hypothetical protein
MSHCHSFHFNGETKHDLGMVICKICRSVIHTLPSDGTTKIYGVCNKVECILMAKEGKEIPEHEL